MPWLINAAQADKFRKNQKNILILDASWHLPPTDRNAQDEFDQKHIPGARFFNIDWFADPNTPIPNMLTRDEKYISDRLTELGVHPDYKIILYDNSPFHSSCRALWMLKVFGHNPNQLYILDGGMSAWERYGGKVDNAPARTKKLKPYPVNYQSHLVRTLMQVKANLHHPQAQIVDMRHAVRFAGGKETRPGMRSGHIPNSFSLPFTSFFERDGTFRPIERLKKVISGIGIEIQQPIITSCGSGITASILNFTLDLINQDKHALYDGSWSEWGSETLYQGETDLSERPVETSLIEPFGEIPPLKDLPVS